MHVKPSFNLGGETEFSFSQESLGQEISPLPNLNLHGHLRVLTGDRIAVAASLLLGSSMAASLKVGRPISQRVATQIRSYVGFEGLNIPETTAVPLAVHTGSVELVVCEEGAELRDVGHADRRRMLFCEVSSHRSAGRLFTYQSITLATNSWIFGKDGLAKTGNSRLETSLAVPVLMAQDLSVSKVNIPASLARLVSGERMASIARLLLMTDLQLSVEGNPVHVH